jgi:peptidoglycan/xylan/chitin deacetylase (PgdA/CDA1 family)
MAALTFDDGPDEHHTPRILEVLSRYNATATFFVLAQRADKHREVLMAIRDAGHEIGLHGDDHSPLVGCSTRRKIELIWGGKRRLEATLGQPVRLFRPPYGWQDVRAFLIARMAGLDVFGWTAEGGDWLDITTEEVVQRALAPLAPGSILLLHDRCEPLPGRPDETPAGHLDRAKMTDEIVRGARDRGLRLVSIGALLRHGRPDRRPWFWRPAQSELPR